VLEHRAELRFGSVAKVAEGPLLNGNLSHRLVEVLFVDGAFDLSEAEFVKQVAVTVDALIKKEAATLLLPGAVFERDQLVRQVRFAMRELYRYLSSSGYRIAAVEEPVAFHSTVGSPHGRLDVRLVDAEGNDAILDLKWGRSTYERYLKTGAAIQLALYSRAVGQRQSPPTSPPAAYYALGKAKVLTTDARMRPEKVIPGISLEDTWSRFQRTRDAVVSRLSLGEVLVAQPTAPALVERLGIPPDRHELYYQAERGDEGPCKFCAFGPVCGNAWEGFR
jgi:hypothetical protein